MTYKLFNKDYLEFGYFVVWSRVHHLLGTESMNNLFYKWAVNGVVCFVEEEYTLAFLQMHRFWETFQTQAGA
jgi:hypothetical protein